MSTDLDDLRSRAIDLGRQRADSDLLQLRVELERDTEMWGRFWAPACALAAGRLGDGPTAWALLEAAVDGGFCQPEVFEGELEAVFAEDPRWSGLLTRIRSNVPPAGIQLESWPRPPGANDVVLFRMSPEAEERLRQRIPAPEASAWDTARKLLAWVAVAWRHDGIQHAGDDAHEILDRVRNGDRFACVEYSTVLSQALNAIRIPSRSVALRSADHHTGYGRCHVVSEAWIDDLQRWVVLDGQNGSLWCDPESGEPLGLVDLVRRQRAAARRPGLVGLTREHPASSADTWWRYFHTVTVEGLRDGESVGATWAPAPYSPVFQDRHWLGVDRLTTNLDTLHPDLSMVHLGLAGSRDEPALRLTTLHPYARELELCTDANPVVVVTQQEPAGLLRADLPLPMSPGRHESEIFVRTPYAALRAGSVTYTAR